MARGTRGRVDSRRLAAGPPDGSDLPGGDLSAQIELSACVCALAWVTGPPRASSRIDPGGGSTRPDAHVQWWGPRSVRACPDDATPPATPPRNSSRSPTSYVANTSKERPRRRPPSAARGPPCRAGPAPRLCPGRTRRGTHLHQASARALAPGQGVGHCWRSSRSLADASRSLADASRSLADASRSLADAARSSSEEERSSPALVRSVAPELRSASAVSRSLSA